MKKKFIVLSSILALSMFMVSCVNNNYNPSNDSGISDNSGNSGNNTNKNDKPSTDDSDNNKNDDNSNSNNASDTDIVKKQVLNEINNNAKNGKVINCEYAVQTSVIEKIIEGWGKADSNEHVDAAKGDYYTFSNKGVVFGCNKGSQVFEVRSFDKTLNTLTLKDVMDFFGSPQYDVTTSGNERIIGYVINSDYKIEFVFPNGGSDSSTLDHYGILWPKGTVNMMADDKGREW